jgi:hypothetical protein
MSGVVYDFFASTHGGWRGHIIVDFGELPNRMARMVAGSPRGISVAARMRGHGGDGGSPMYGVPAIGMDSAQDLGVEFEAHQGRR